MCFGSEDFYGVILTAEANQCPWNAGQPSGTVLENKAAVENGWTTPIYVSLYSRSVNGYFQVSQTTGVIQMPTTVQSGSILRFGEFYEYMGGAVRYQSSDEISTTAVVFPSRDMDDKHDVTVDYLVDFC